MQALIQLQIKIDGLMVVKIGWSILGDSFTKLYNLLKKAIC